MRQKSHKNFSFLTKEQLENLNVQRLLGVLKSARAVRLSIRNRAFCYCGCGFEYMSEEEYKKFNEYLKPFDDYLELLHKILEKLPNID